MRRTPLAVLLLLVLPNLCWPTGTATGQIPGFGRGAEQDTAPFMGLRDSTGVVDVTAAPASARVPRGGDLAVKIVLDVDGGWHIWTNDRVLDNEYAQFDGAVHTEIAVSEPAAGLVPHLDYLQWPAIHGVKADVGDGLQTYAVFEGRAIAFLPVTVAADAPLGATTFVLTVSFQACDDSQCLAPAAVTVPVNVEVVETATGSVATEVDPDFAAFDPTAFGKIRAGVKAPSLVEFDVFGQAFALDVSGWLGFALLLLVAAGGGFLLNLTPCVLPVIPLKIMGLSSAAGNPRRCFALGVSMSLGVIGFWLGLGALVASVTWFKSANQLFQLPLFTIGVGVVIAIMAIGMAGFFSVSLPQWVYSINPSHETHTGSFGFGVMTAVLSTPCTAPLMGAAAAWAATQHSSTTLIVFGAIGTGMALPYMVLSAFPQLVNRMPRSGPASELIKQVMGLLLLAAAAYFVGAGLSGLLTDAPQPPSKSFWWVVAAFGLVAGAWLAWRTVRITPSFAKRLVFAGMGALVMLVSVFVGVSQTRHGPIDWVYYTPEEFERAVAGGNVVVMDFTAEWCLNCKALETTMLFPEAVSSLLKRENGVVPIKVDITGNNEPGNDMLRTVGRITIPLLVVFAPDGSEVFKSDSYTAQQVIDAIDRAKQMRRVEERQAAK